MSLILNIGHRHSKTVVGEYLQVLSRINADLGSTLGRYGVDVKADATINYISNHTTPQAASADC